MSEVRSTACARSLDPCHTVRSIIVGLDCSFDSRIKRWPPGTGIKFGRRGEQGRATTNAGIDAVAVVIPIFPGECALRTGLASNAILFTGQLRLPFGVGLVYFGGHGVDSLQGRDRKSVV